MAGLGFAALRDLGTFLRDAKADDNGVANPLAGDVQHIYTFCGSQPCRTTHDFILWGFNEAERQYDQQRHDYDAGRDESSYRDDRRRPHLVFDGMLNWLGGGNGIFMNYRFAQPTRTHRQHIARWTPEFQFPFANQVLFDPVTRQVDGRLAACERTGTCPKIMETNSENEYWAKGGSMLTTDGQGHDLNLNDVENVRYYFISSAPHSPGTLPGICQQPQNPIVGNQVLRALLDNLDAWVTFGRRPPDNRVPKLADGTLAPALPQSGMGFPSIPGVTYNGVHHTGDLWNFGPKFDQGILSLLPPVLVGEPYKIFVPKTDIDGNDIAGIRLPDIAVPLATYTGWALRAQAAGDPEPIVDGCDASGQRLPFAATQAARMATNPPDPRLSIAERYPDHGTYVTLVTETAEKLEQNRLLIDQDVQNYIAAAQAAAVP